MHNFAKENPVNNDEGGAASIKQRKRTHRRGTGTRTGNGTETGTGTGTGTETETGTGTGTGTRTRTRTSESESAESGRNVRNFVGHCNSTTTGYISITVLKFMPREVLPAEAPKTDPCFESIEGSLPVFGSRPDNLP